MKLHQTAALVLALLCAVPLLTGCGRGTAERPTIAEEDMPYGSTMREDKTSFAVPVTYDRRFLGTDEVTKVANLYAAIQNSDAALYQETTLPFYLEYQQKQVYSLDSPEALIGHLHSMIAEKSGDDFRYTMVLITDMAANPNAGTLRNVVEMLEDAYDGSGSFLDIVENSYDLTVEWHVTFNSDSETSVVEDQHMFLFQTADGWFAVV